MKFIIDKNEFLNVLSKIQGLTGRKSSLAITNSILIESMENSVRITATDLETGFQGCYPAEVIQEGKIALNSKKMFEIVRDFPNSNICINEVDNRWIEIGTTHVEYHIAGMHADEFPDFPKLENILFFTMATEKLSRMIEKMVIITSSSDEKRSHIVGTLFEINPNDGEGFIRMVSTDGNRLSTVDCAVEKEVRLPDESRYIVPKKGLTELNRFIGSQGDVQIGFKDSYLISQKASETSVIRLLEGEFPNYRDILVNKSQGNMIRFDKQNLMMMLKRMSILSSDDYKGIIFSFSEDKLVVNSTNPEIGESKEEMTIVYKGKPIQAAFNPRFFMDAINCIDDDAIEFTMINEEKPCFVQGAEHTDYLSVIMPMRL